ncbi:MAG: VOC family protein [Gammaproteobacteria bacterium]
MNDKKKPPLGEFCWNELMTSDPKKAKEFYSALFGWESHDIDMGNAVYTMFKSGAKDIAGMMQIPQGQQNQIPPHWMSYVSVDNLDAMVAKAKTLGAKIKVPVTPVADFGSLVVLEDNTGAHIALWQAA